MGKDTVFTEEFIDFICGLIKGNLIDHAPELDTAYAGMDEVKISLPVVVRLPKPGKHEWGLAAVDSKISFKMSGNVENVVTGVFDPEQLELPSEATITKGA